MRDQVAALAQAAAPNADAAIEFGQPIQFATSRLTASIYNANSPGAVAFGETHDAVGLIAWLWGDQLIAKLDKAIDDAADDGAALTREQREVQEAQVLSDMLAVERREVALIFAAEAQGTMIDFRPDTSPQALLGLRLAIDRMPASQGLRPSMSSRSGARDVDAFVQPGARLPAEPGMHGLKRGSVSRFGLNSQNSGSEHGRRGKRHSS
ncbi:hypothetical protein [Bradyrhizobium sp. CCGUVB23]|uniref:hypothetical protein n=1 Tax=Bradyrhizobium sp. CCGUVB23 TaxID=2949630 RepID=UPI0020B22205|nr:hypothetical protein [Bradyrhizobium sp. CCGUVB23]MCP3459763.1 hypothetical protein [Bradyrhizobium sp. CCGUVB23]